MRNLTRPGEGFATDTGHDQTRERLMRQYAAIPPGTPIRLSKRTSNLFRYRERTSGPGLDASGLDQVLSVDPVSRTADVQAMTTYERLGERRPVPGPLPPRTG